MPRLHATPYDITYSGFYFDSAEEFTARMQTAPFEEVEIQFIDGTDEECTIGKLYRPHQGNVAGYFAAIEEHRDAQELAAITYLIEYQGLTWEEATDPDTLTDVDVHAMRLRDLAEHFAEEGIYPPGVSAAILPYLDYALITRDLETDYTEITCLGIIYSVRAP
jgi:hypothetical protein